MSRQVMHMPLWCVTPQLMMFFSGYTSKGSVSYLEEGFVFIRLLREERIWSLYEQILPIKYSLFWKVLVIQGRKLEVTKLFLLIKRL